MQYPQLQLSDLEKIICMSTEKDQRTNIILNDLIIVENQATKFQEDNCYSDFYENKITKAQIDDSIEALGKDQLLQNQTQAKINNEIIISQNINGNSFKTSQLDQLFYGLQQQIIANNQLQQINKLFLEILFQISGEKKKDIDLEDSIKVKFSAPEIIVTFCEDLQCQFDVILQEKFIRAKNQLFELQNKLNNYNNSIHLCMDLQKDSSLQQICIHADEINQNLQNNNMSDLQELIADLYQQNAKLQNEKQLLEEKIKTSTQNSQINNLTNQFCYQDNYNEHFDQDTYKQEICKLLEIIQKIECKLNFQKNNISEVKENFETNKTVKQKSKSQKSQLKSRPKSNNEIMPSKKIKSIQQNQEIETIYSSEKNDEKIEEIIASLEQSKYQEKITEVKIDENKQIPCFACSEKQENKLDITSCSVMENIMQNLLDGIQPNDSQLQQLNDVERIVINLFKDKIIQSDEERNRCPKKKKRVEENQKMFFKNAMNFLEEKFFTNTQPGKRRLLKREKDFLKYYQYYFEDVAEKQNINLENFIHPNKKQLFENILTILLRIKVILAQKKMTKTNLKKQKKQNSHKQKKEKQVIMESGQRSFNQTYINIILLSEKFRKDVQAYLQNFFEQEYLTKRNKKIMKLLQKCQKIMNTFSEDIIQFYNVDISQKREQYYQYLLQKITVSFQKYLLHDSKTKIPWTRQEITVAKMYAQSLLQKIDKS